MKIRSIIFTVLLVALLVNGHTQIPMAKQKVTIDNDITAKIKKFKTVAPGRLESSMKIKVPWDDRSLFDQELDCFTKSYLTNDTINITGYMIGGLGYGFELKLFGDSCIAAPYGLSDGQIYKYHKADTKYVNLIKLPTQKHKVALSKHASFKEGEIIEGYVELESYPFYYKGLNGKFSINVKAYFKTDSVKNSR
jgi:hypothetical protein